MDKINICIGSSCFCRGNNDHLEMIEKFLQEMQLEEQVDFVGSGCSGQCAEGPNITINGQTYHGIDQQALIDLLNNLAKNKA